MKIGIIGAGQLARMLVLSATPLGFTFSCIGKDGDCAGDVTSLVDIDLKDTKSLLDWASSCDAITFENENIDCNLIDSIPTTVSVYPPVKAIKCVQDRLAEKDMLTSLGIKTAPYRSITSLDSLTDAVKTLGMPAIIKTRRFGYDGKGQHTIKVATDIGNAWDVLGSAPDGIIYEGFVNFEREVSLICSRNIQGEIVFYPLTHTIHNKGVLLETMAPYVNDTLEEQAQDIAKRVCENFDYVGTLAIEFFVEGSALIVNEIAPRVHNSGHWTIEGSTTSQFENHIRAIAGLSLGSCDSQKTIMFNCLGGMPSIMETSKFKNVKRHDYHKSPKFGRKIGHVTISHSASKEELQAIRQCVEAKLQY